MPSEREITAFHEGAHAVVAVHFALRVRRIHIDPPRGLTSFWQDGPFLRLAPRRRCLISMAGEAAEAKVLGRVLVPDITKIRDAVQRLRRGETVPRSDINNIARTLAAEKCDDLIADLLALRARAIERLLDHDVWARVTSVAVALVDRGELSGPEDEALVGDADQQLLQRDTIFRLVT